MIPAALCLLGRDLTEPRPSPDGRWVLVGTRAGGRAGLMVVPSAGGTERALAVDPLPALGRGFGGGCTSWLPDSSGFVYAAVDGQVWLHQLDGTRRPLTHLEPGRSVSAPAVSPDGTKVAYVADLAEVRVVGVHDGVDAVVSAEWDFVNDPAWHPDGERLVWHAWSVPAMPWDHAVAVTTTAEVIGTADRQLQQPRFGPDGRLWSVRDDHGWLNVWRGDAPVAEEPFEHAGPVWGPGQRSYAVSPDGTRVAFSRNEAGFGRLCVAAVAGGPVREVARGVHGQLTWVGERLVALRSGARTPTQVVVYDTVNWERAVLAVGPTVEWDQVALVEPELFTAAAADGTAVPARCYRPAGGGDGRLICWVHGGPTDQWPVTFNPRVAFFVSRGWTVVVPDHRGSTGHGRRFQQALRGGWGEADVADVEAVLAHAHAAGWGRPTGTVMLGGSAGAFTALNVAIHAPHRVAGVAVAYPVTDLATLDEHTHRFEAHYTATLAGVSPEVHHRRSPLTHAARLRRPALVLHGDADPVVPVAASVEFAERVRAAGGDIELVVYPGEGHGFRQPANQADELARLDAFVARVVQ